MTFEWRPIREHDADGRLAAAGVQWFERRELAQTFCIMMAVFSFVGAAAAWMLCAANHGMGRDAAIMLSGLCVLTILWGRWMRGRMRQLIFHHDGGIKAPLGFRHYKARCKEITGHHEHIVSIEARGQGDAACDVVIYSRGGDVAYVAGSLSQDEAHKVAVQLTLALAELRESMGREAVGGDARNREAALVD